MVFKRKRNKVFEQIYQSMIQTISNLQDKYLLARENELNLQNTDVDQRQIHSRVQMAKSKHAYMLRQAKIMEKENAKF